MPSDKLEQESWVLGELLGAGVLGRSEDEILARCWYLETEDVMTALGGLVARGLIVQRGEGRWGLPSPIWCRRIEEGEAFSVIAEGARSYRDEGREFESPKRERRYRVSEVSSNNIEIDRLDGGDPARISEDAAARAARLINAAGGTLPRGQLLGSVAAETAFVELHPSLAWAPGANLIVAEPGLNDAQPRRSHLLTWNPSNWDWETLPSEIEKTRRGEPVFGIWSSGSTKSILPGERVFMIRLGKGERGLFGIGTVLSPVFERPHWDEDRYDDGDRALYLLVRWDRLLDPEREVLPMDRLKDGALAAQNWSPQGSGIRIQDELVPELLGLWAEHVGALAAPGEIADAAVRDFQDRDGESALFELERWCKDHPDGFIVAARGSRKGGMLHRVGCSHLMSDADFDTSWNITRRPKICSTSKAALLRWAEEQGISSLKTCSDCKP